MDFSSVAALGCAAVSGFISCELCLVHLMYTKTVRTLDRRAVFILVLENMCNSFHLQGLCSTNSLKACHAALTDPGSV